MATASANGLNGIVAGVVGSANYQQNGGAAAPITGATGGIFSYASGGAQAFVNLTGASFYEQLPFLVRASGFVSLPAGTYTATVQPLIYALTTTGFTAAVGSAIFSAAAANVTVAAATATTSYPYLAQATLFGDTISGKVNGFIQGISGTEATAPIALAVIANAPTAVTFTAAVPLQFSAGVTLGNAGASSVVSLGSLWLET